MKLMPFALMTAGIVLVFEGFSVGVRGTWMGKMGVVALIVVGAGA
jgi:hypothetical protein